MGIQVRFAFVSGSIAAVLQLFIAASAFAHHPEISAVAVCDDNSDLVIDYASTAWASANPLKRTNPQIDILVNNVKVDQGAYASPAFSFSGSVAAPPGTSATVTALAVANWGDGFAGGQTRSVTVTYPTEACATPSLGRFTGGGIRDSPMVSRSRED